MYLLECLRCHLLHVLVTPRQGRRFGLMGMIKKEIHVSYEDESLKLTQVCIYCLLPNSSQGSSREHHDSACSLVLRALSKTHYHAKQLNM